MLGLFRREQICNGSNEESLDHNAQTFPRSSMAREVSWELLCRKVTFPIPVRTDIKLFKIAI